MTSLRAEVGVRLSSRVDLTPWFAYQARYDFTLAKYDINGNITTPAGGLDAVSPVLGLEARFTLGQLAEGWRQPPTQH